MPTCDIVTACNDIIASARALQIRTAGIEPTVTLPDNLLSLCGDGQGLINEIYGSTARFVRDAGSNVIETVPRPVVPASQQCHTETYLTDVKEWIDGIILPCTATNVYEPDNGWNDVTISGSPSAGNGSITASFLYDDSAECGGSNAETQSGRCEFTVVLSVATVVGYRVYGNVETENAGFDFAAAIRDGATKASITSVTEGGGCVMESADSTLIEETLQAGTYLFAIAVNTQDGQWHAGMVHNFEIIFGEGDI